MKLSVLDLSLVPQGNDRHQALMHTLDMAQHAERWGYHRFWMAEHHGAGTAAGRSPEVMIPFIASHTQHIKVGSGAVLLNHYSPYKVAEVFNSLEELFPGRVDMGIGRATTGPVGDLALQSNRSIGNQQSIDSESQLRELRHWMDKDFPESHPFSKIQSYNNGTTPEFWILGSSPFSAKTAAKLGLPYAFSGFINPGNAYAITRIYHKEFTSSKATPEPKLLLALNVFVAPTEKEANTMAAPFDLFEKRLQTQGDIHSLLETEDNAIKTLGGLPKNEPLIDPKQPPRKLVGTPEMVKNMLKRIGDTFDVDEMMIHTVSANHEARLRSYKLLSEVFAS